MMDGTSLDYKLKAWAPLDDAIEAITRLNQLSAQEIDRSWRIYYLASVTLLRAIGHVLSKVDGSANPAVAKRLKEIWPLMKVDPVFVWVESERNAALKAYELNASVSRSWTWVGEPKSLGDFSDAEEEALLFTSDTDELAVDKLLAASSWWGEVLACIQYQRKSRWPGAQW